MKTYVRQRQRSIALFERGKRRHDHLVTTRLVPNSDALLLLRGSIVRSASDSVHSLLGWEPELSVGRSLTELFGTETYELLDELQTAAEQAGGHFATLHALPLEDIDRERIWVDATIGDMRHDEDVSGTILILHDVTERVRLEATIGDHDHHDPLTATPNKRMFELLLSQSISTNEPVGVIIATVPHHDDLPSDDDVVRMARRLETNLRAGDHVGRVDEHTFGLVIHSLDVTRVDEDIAEVIQRVVLTLRSGESRVEIGSSHSVGRNVSALQLIAEAQRRTVEA
jgi:PAS domain S-box-containing protein